MDEMQSAQLLQTNAQLASRGIHDPDFKIFRRIFLNRVPIIYDIGSNRGQSIGSFSAIFPEMIVHAFELNPQFYPVLHAISRTVKGVTIHEHGLGDAEGNFPFYIPLVQGEHRLEEASADRESFNLPWVKARLTKADPNYILENRMGAIKVGDALGLPLPDIIKIDVEGFEFHALKGLENVLRRSVPVIIAENSDYVRVTKFLSGIGYKPFRYNQESEILIPFHGETVNTIYVAIGHDRGVLSEPDSPR